MFFSYFFCFKSIVSEELSWGCFLVALSSTEEEYRKRVIDLQKNSKNNYKKMEVHIMAELAIERYIESAHGTTKIHGHNFKINVTFTGAIKNNMVAGIDFHDAKKQENEVLDTLDKKYLNDIEGMGRATVENIAIYIIKHLNHLSGLESVTVWEGMDKYTKIYANEVKETK